MDDAEDPGVPIRIPVNHGFRFRWYPFDTQIKKAGLKGIVPCLPPEERGVIGRKSKTPAEGKIHTVRALSTYILTQALLDVNDLAMMIHEKQALHRPGQPAAFLSSRSTTASGRLFILRQSKTTRGDWRSARRRLRSIARALDALGAFISQSSPLISKSGVRS